MHVSDPKRPSTALILALAAGTAGFAMNQIGLPVFGSIEMVFGGVFTLLATYVLGPWWGALGTLLAFSVTRLTWGHPVGLICFTLEAVAVGWLVRRRLHPLMAALLYWAFVGMPLASLAILRYPEFPFPNNWAVLIKYPLNSLLSALIVLPLFRSGLFRRTLGLPLDPDANTPLTRVLFNQLGLIVALALGTLALIAGGQFDRSMRDEASESIANDGHEVALDLESYLDRHLRALVLLADLQAGAPPRPDDAPDPFSRMHSVHPGFLELLATDANGLVIAAWPARSRSNQVMANNGVVRSGLPAFLVPQATRRPYVSDLQRKSGFGNELVVAISAPIIDRQGRFRGVVEGSLNLERLFQAISRTGQLRDRIAVVTDRSRRVVVSAGPVDAPALSSFSLHPMATGAATGGDTFLFNLADGRGRTEQFLGTRERVPGFDWDLYLAEPVWHTQAHIAFFYLGTALAAAFAIGLGLWLTRATAQEITRPLAALAEATHRLAAGDVAAELPALQPGARELAMIGAELRAATLTLSRANRELVEAVAARDLTQEELRRVLTSLEAKVRERTSELEVARRAAESASEAKSEFLASMSHELRTPLNVIVGMSELLSEGHLGPLEARQEEGARSIFESGRHLLELINDILDLSKIEAGMLELRVQPVEVEALCEASLRFIREAALKKNLTIKQELAPGLPRFTADQRRIKQVLVNLLANAVKFTPADGTIGLDVRLAAGGQVIRFEVWDTGIGIASENFQRIFQPFQQIDSSLARQYAGTGLGLALVRSMVHLHGGCVDVESETGRGSRFILSFPLVDPADAPATPDAVTASVPPLPLARARILIAEDNEANNIVYNSFFATRDCELYHAGNGREAIRLAVAHRPDLILMDVHMPEMDGLEAIRQLRANPATARCPIIAVTALAMEGDRTRCLDAGADAYLSKPINLRELARLIARYTASVPVSSPVT